MIRDLYHPPKAGSSHYHTKMGWITMIYSLPPKSAPFHRINVSCPRTQHSFSRTQRSFSRTQHSFLRTQHSFSRTHRSFSRTQHSFSRTQRSFSRTQRRVRTSPASHKSGHLVSLNTPTWAFKGGFVHRLYICGSRGGGFGPDPPPP